MVYTYSDVFKAEWEGVTTRLKNSGYDLSKIKIKEGEDDTRASKRDSKNNSR